MKTSLKIVAMTSAGLLAGVAAMGGVASGEVLVATEDADAGQLPGGAQHLSEAVGAVTGALATTGDIDLYRFCAGDEGLSVSTVNDATAVDTQLFLFAGDGTALAANDESDGTRQSRIALDAAGAPAGEYLVGVSSWDNDPKNAGGEYFFSDVSTQVEPYALDDLVLAAWDDIGRESGAYRIDFVGAVACGPATGEVAGVVVDVKPGSDDNPMNLRARGRTPVAVLGSADLDVSSIDPATVVAGPGAAPALHVGVEDVDGDAVDDLVAHFDTRALGLSSTDTELCIEASAGGSPVSGCDAIRVR